MTDIPHSEAAAKLPTIGFIGLGTMGSGMAANLLKARYPMVVFDIDADRLAACADAGAEAAESARHAVERAEIVLTSLPSSAVFAEVAEEALLPAARESMVFIDLGTTEGAITRRVAGAMLAKGATLLDAPVSGGGRGAADGTLRVFVGGNRQAADRCRPIFDVLGDPAGVGYCGLSGSGQAVKAVNQLAMGLVPAAYLEAIAFAVRSGADLDAVRTAVGGDDGWRGEVARYAAKVQDGSADEVLIKFPEMPYFLREARELGFALPITEAIFAFCDGGPRNWTDNMGRPRVAFWHQLMHGTAPNRSTQ